MPFLTEKALLDHCKQVHHPPLKPNIKAMTPQKLEFGGQGYKCQECQAMITCVPWSPQFSSHWISHSSTISTMRFLNMESSQVMVLGDIYPESAQCKARDCLKFFSSQISFEDVELRGTSSLTGPAATWGRSSTPPPHTRPGTRQEDSSSN